MTDKMKVALIGPVPPPAGGIASWTLRMLHSELAAQSVEFIHVDESVSAGREIFGAKAKRNYIEEAKRCRRIWNDLSEALKTETVSVVHANIPAAPLSILREIICARIANKHDVPFVIHFRCTVPVYASDLITRQLLKKLLSRSSAAIVLNAASKACIESISGTPAYLIPNFISSEEITAARNNSRSYDGPLKKVLYTGGIIESKGAFDILEIAKAIPGVEFRLAGKGELPVGTVVPENVRLLGQLNRDEIIEEYRHADAFIFLSRFKGEGFSNSLVEAMVFGLPCIVSDWAANADMVRPDGGIVVDYRDIDSIVQSLKSLNDPAVRCKMGAANQNKAMSFYSETAVINQYLKLYRMVSRE